MLNSLRDDTPAKDFQKIANGFNNDSKELQNSYDYEFPMQDAVACIPDFFGKPEELNSFINQIDFFAEGFPKYGNKTPLINVVKMKLKGNASYFVDSISGKSWKVIKDNLIKEFKAKNSLEDVLADVETLAQKKYEPFKNYKERALKILKIIETLNDSNSKEDDYALKSLRF